MTTKILVLCTGNSCRSQMAEAYLKYFAKNFNVSIEIYSAGTEAHGINPRAIKTLCEDGISIKGQTSNQVEEYLNFGITHLLTVCDNAQENCPIFTEKIKNQHYNFKDPSKIKGSSKEIKASFKSTREEIKIYCENYIKTHFL